MKYNLVTWPESQVIMGSDFETECIKCQDLSCAYMVPDNLINAVNAMNDQPVTVNITIACPGVCPFQRIDTRCGFREDDSPDQKLIQCHTDYRPRFPEECPLRTHNEYRASSDDHWWE